VADDADKEEEEKKPTYCGGIRVFVPLCGKTVDMAYLAQLDSVQQVVGVEGIRTAIEEFAHEQPQLNVVRSTVSSSVGFEQWDGTKISIFKGNFFQVDMTVVGGERFGVMFDRGSLVAIEPTLRHDYITTISNLIAPGGKILLVTLERRGSDNDMVQQGPPYSISESDVRKLYGSLEWVQDITVLEQEDVLEKDPSQRDRYKGLDALMEIAFLIQAKSSW